MLSVAMLKMAAASGISKSEHALSCVEKPCFTVLETYARTVCAGIFMKCFYLRNLVATFHMNEAKMEFRNQTWGVKAKSDCR